MSFRSIPVIDVSPLVLARKGALDESHIEVEQTRKQLSEAMRDVGFLQVVGHGVDVKSKIPSLLRLFSVGRGEKALLLKRQYLSSSNNGNVEDRDMIEMAREARREEVESAPLYRGYFPCEKGQFSYKEGFDCGRNWRELAEGVGSSSSSSSSPPLPKGFPLSEAAPYPAEDLLPGWKKDMEEYYQQCQELGMTLLDAMAVGLGLERDAFTRFMTNPEQPSVSTLRLLRYPRKEIIEEEEDGEKDASAIKTPLVCSRHTDSGILTLLWQDKTGGLEAVNSEGEEIAVPPIEGAMVVNLGDLLSTWTNGAVRATVHQVRGSNAERFSVPFFVEPGFDSRLFDNIVYGPWLIEKMAREFVEFRNLTDYLEKEE